MAEISLNRAKRLASEVAYWIGQSVVMILFILLVLPMMMVTLFLVKHFIGEDKI